MEVSLIDFHLNLKYSVAKNAMRRISVLSFYIFYVVLTRKHRRHIKRHEYIIFSCSGTYQKAMRIRKGNFRVSLMTFSFGREYVSIV